MEKKRIIYRCKYFTVFKKELMLPTGKKYLLYGMDRPDGAVIIPVLNGKLIMLRHFRAGTGEWDYEVPMGFVDKGENPKTAAVRELIEETGYRAKKIRYLFSSFIIPSFTKQRGHFFLAECGERIDKHDVDKTEVAEVKILSLQRALRMIGSNRIRGATTIQAILFYNQYARKKV